MPFFNRTNNEDLILAIQSARVSRGRDGFFLRFATKALRDNRKDKGGEKLAETEESLLEHRTDAPTRFLPVGRSYFVVDTLYIGCEKFPYRDSFSLSMSGAL